MINMLDIPEDAVVSKAYSSEVRIDLSTEVSYVGNLFVVGSVATTEPIFLRKVDGEWAIKFYDDDEANEVAFGYTAHPQWKAEYINAKVVPEEVKRLLD